MVRSLKKKPTLNAVCRPDVSSPFSILRTARLQLTDELIGDLNVRSDADDAGEDMQKIQELLSLPRNEDVTQDSGSQGQ